MDKKKIAIISACIGNAGKTDAIKFSDAAMCQLKDYGVDFYLFGNEHLEQLESIKTPSMTEEQIGFSFKDYPLKYWWYGIKYRQPVFPKEEDTYTRLIAKLPKILFYKLVPEKYDYYIWLDSKFTIYEHWLDYVLWLIDINKDFDILTSRHSERCSVKEELDFMCKYLHNGGVPEKYNMGEIMMQYDFYQHESFKDNRLYELTMMIYSRNVFSKRLFLEEW